MSLSSWLGVKNVSNSGQKRKADESLPIEKMKKFNKVLNQNDFSWYVQDEKGFWHCSLCKAAGKQNAYARGHENPAKTTNHDRHSKSNDHLDAVLKSTMKEKAPMRQILSKVIEKDDLAATAALKVSYWLGVKELPKSMFSDTMELLDSLGLDLSDKLSRNGNVNYSSAQSISEFQSSLASVLSTESVDAINKSGMFGLTLDESTDRANKKRLVVYAQYLDENNALKTDFIENVQIVTASANAETIVNCVVDTLKTKGIDISGLVGLGTDGASVMTGRKNGVVAKLKELNPYILGVHCAAHRCSLAASQAAKLIPDLMEFNRTLANIFFYFSNSALRSNKLREIQSLLGLPELKYAQIFSVRWLSVEKAVNVVYRTYPALCVALDHEATTNTTAKGLLSTIKQYKFIALTHHLMDILPIISRLSKIFQTEAIDYSTIKPVVTMTKELLVELNEIPGKFAEKLDEFISDKDGKVTYERDIKESSKEKIDKCIGDNLMSEESVENVSDQDQNVSQSESVKVDVADLKYYVQQKESVKKSVNKYIDEIAQNLDQRFDDSMELLTNCQVFVPENIASSKKQGSLKFSNYGVCEVGLLYDHYVNNGLLQDVTRDELLVEYSSYKRLVSVSYGQMSMLECYDVMKRKYCQTVPHVTYILQLILSIPVTSVSCERGFSTQNRIVTNFRTTLNNQSLNDLMRLSEGKRAMSDFNFGAALQQWKNAKQRRLYNRQ